MSSYLDQRRLQDVLAAEKLIETHADEYEVKVPKDLVVASRLKR